MAIGFQTLDEVKTVMGLPYDSVVTLLQERREVAQRLKFMATPSGGGTAAAPQAKTFSKQTLGMSFARVDSVARES